MIFAVDFTAFTILRISTYLLSGVNPGLNSTTFAFAPAIGDNTMKIAVITGASSGMGREFVYAFDKDEQFDELWVIARREDRLVELQSRCRARVRPIVLDLGQRESSAFHFSRRYFAESV